MQFAESKGLWVLAAWPVIAWLLFYGLKRKNLRMAKCFETAVWPVLLPFRRPDRLQTAVVLQLAAIVFLILALARPQWGFQWEEVRAHGLNVVVVLDTSRSMLAEDLKPNRLQRAKWGVRDLVERLRGDRLGLVAFSGSAFLQCPLTSDSSAFLMTLDDVYAGLVPRGGTSLAAALRLALTTLDRESNADLAIVILSDGEDHEGGWEPLVEELKKREIRVFSIGVATPAGELIPLPDPAQGSVPIWLQDREGHPVLSRLREDPMETLALATGGLYVRSTPGDFGMDRVAAQILGLKRADLGDRRVRVAREQYGWFVGAALILLGIEALLLGRLRRFHPALASRERQEA